jgi:hypothetical protein
MDGHTGYTVYRPYAVAGGDTTPALWKKNRRIRKIIAELSKNQGN